ncbi:MAG TPA: phosphoribosyltransferase family protein [Thermoplasmata archaeon]|nr:phosphoribosyltransferase family protein [Thermoplasmata archaeon]
MPELPSQIFENHQLCARLKADHPGRFSCSKDDPKAERRVQWRSGIALAGNLPFPFVLEDAVSLVNILLSQVVVKIGALSGEVVFVGIEKKGMALLNELVELLPPLKAYPRVSDSELSRVDLTDANVIVIDDIVNHGVTLATVYAEIQRFEPKQVHSIVLLGREDGVKSLRKQSIPVEAVLEVKDELFSTLFLVWVSPLLRHLRNGAISNRPHRVYQIHSPTASIETAANATLRALLDVPSVDCLEEVGACDGSESPIYHGTLSLRESLTQEITRLLEPGSEVDQVKVRFFIGPFSPLPLHICSIVWPISPGNQPPEEPTKAAASWLLTRIVRELSERLNPQGYTLVADDRSG